MAENKNQPKIEVVDTNVWANIDKLPPENEIERACILACLEWGKAFSEGDDQYKIAVDISYKILSEYRRQIKPGGLAEQYLNKVLSQPITRLAFRQIEFDENGHAVLKDAALMTDPSDRKFVAVALTSNPSLPIINATDTDWAKNEAKLATAHIVVVELCENYIASKHSP